MRSEHTPPVKKALPYENYFNIRAGLPHFYQHAVVNKSVTVAFLGGSITYNPGWRQFVCSYLQERFSQTRFHFIQAGIPSLGSLPHAFRLQRDVLDSGKVDLLFIEAAVNDRVNSTDSLTQVRALEGIVRHAKASNPDMDMVMMEFADPDKNADYAEHKTPAEIANHELVASHYHLPSINLAKEVFDKINNHEFSWKNDFKDLHPARYGQMLYFESIKQLLEKCFAETTKIRPAHAVTALLNQHSLTNGSYYNINNAKCNNDWRIDKDWTPADNMPTRERFVHVPVLQTEKPGAALTLVFKGDAIGIAIVSGPDAGTISYSVDNSPVKHIDLYTQWSSQLHLPWYLLLGSGLKNGTHKLWLSTDSAKNAASKGSACRIVYFLINR